MPQSNLKPPLSKTHPKIAKEANGWNPSLITGGSSKKVNWKCPKGHVYEASVHKRTSRGDGCSICSGQQVLIGYNDLASKNPEIAKEAFGWDPSTVTTGTMKRFNWKCPKGHVYEASVHKRTSRGDGCSVCGGKTVLSGFNDLASNFPEIAKQADGWDPAQFASATHVIKYWICPQDHRYKARISTRTRDIASGCPYCANKKILPGFNDLATAFPEIAKEADGWDATLILPGIAKQLDWRCKYGHRWTTSPNIRTGHNKSGCPTCSTTGFDPNADGYLYFLVHRDWEMYQIGITNVPDRRLTSHKRLGWEVLELRGPMDGHLTNQWETAILKMLKAKGADLSNIKIAGKFDGYSEAWSMSTFPVNSIKELMRFTEEFEDGKSVTNLSHRKTKKD